MTAINQGIGDIIKESYVIPTDPDKLALFEAKDKFLYGALQQSKNAEFKNNVKKHESGRAAYLEIIATWTKDIIADLALEQARQHLSQLSLATWNGTTMLKLAVRSSSDYKALEDVDQREIAIGSQ